MKHRTAAGSRCVPHAIRIAGTTFWVCLLFLLDSSLGADDIRFNEHIRPILAEHCLHCHGPDERQRKGALRLDLEKAAKASVIVAGDPDTSTFMHRITSPDLDERMPPPSSGKMLGSQQIALLRQWIKSGASYQGHWAFESIVQPELPATQTAAPSEIDRFIVAKLETQGLKLSAKISRQQLIRRATFDLIGMPPTWEEVQAFVADERPDAFAKLIDRLLDSPRYGERWGRHWLDLARYADTHGGSAIGFKKFPFSYTYRDYVINAFNADLPYDRFVTEQVAADQLGLAENDPALAGLGFLTIGMQFRNPHDVIDDQIDVVTRGLMGLTVACARCHDHKYDPIPTTDYYALAGIFTSTETMWGIAANEKLTASPTDLHVLKAAPKVLPPEGFVETVLVLESSTGIPKPLPKPTWPIGTPLAIGVRDKAKPAD